MVVIGSVETDIRIAPQVVLLNPVRGSRCYLFDNAGDVGRRRQEGHHGALR
ncbi:MAG TPA: hypothetical protein VKI44_03780 [Acetobacteraceae bacterium]|nr:hypothetical protein [Acetobacteraceae bacterium]